MIPWKTLANLAGRTRRPTDDRDAMTAIAMLAASITASSFELTLHLHSAAADMDKDALFWKIATPGSSDYLHFYPSAEALADIFGAPPGVVEDASVWLLDRLTQLWVSIEAAICISQLID